MNHIKQVQNKESEAIEKISLASFGTEILLADAVPHTLSGNKAGREIDAGGSEWARFCPHGLSVE
ncbi:hypothetical protein Xbed_00241 [Xenorhabdus beddingii]|uniref:Uncharacterized protein n=1 Tax=Xenorhabdus beddingii TaxID=40578 RepID=A0A1Y2SUE5_9GAMM|nr:hypothetical protein [Xenorhabdus beddingii]OTA21992.1 hypothetical protein Xbed_00241 [Xenorhabdus beddingii]